MQSRFLLGAGVGLLALTMAGCGGRAQLKKTENPSSQQAQAVEEPSLRGKDYQEVPELATVYFDLDQSTLRSDARDTLKKNYQALQNHTDWEILVEGHCDERGTTEYNLALGQRRAAAIRSYYITLGAEGGSIATLSYGKEKPVCEEHSEDCWSKNRRGVSKARTNSKIPASQNPNP